MYTCNGCGCPGYNDHALCISRQATSHISYKPHTDKTTHNTDKTTHNTEIDQKIHRDKEMNSNGNPGKRNELKQGCSTALSRKRKWN